MNVENVNDVSAENVDQSVDQNASADVQQEVSKTQKRRGRPVDKRGGLYKARQIVAELQASGSLTREAAVAKFQTIVDADGNPMSKQTASAYYSLILRGK